LYCLVKKDGEIITLNKNAIKLLFSFIIGLLFFLSILPLVGAITDSDGPLEVYTSDRYIDINPGEDVTITWTFTVPFHEYAIWWEITGWGVNISGWGVDANCTTPIINTTNTEKPYNCNVYYARYHVLSTVYVRCQYEPEDNGGNDDEEPTDGGNGVVIPGFAPYFFILAFSILAIGVIFTFHFKFKKQKVEK